VNAEPFIDVARRGGTSYVVKINGAINLNNAARLQEALLDALSLTPTRLVVDLSAVNSIDTSGLQVLLSTYRRTTAAGGWLLLERANADLAHLLQQNGLPTIGSPPSDDGTGITPKPSSPALPR